MQWALWHSRTIAWLRHLRDSLVRTHEQTYERTDLRQQQAWSEVVPWKSRWVCSSPSHMSPPWKPTLWRCLFSYLRALFCSVLLSRIPYWHLSPLLIVVSWYCLLHCVSRSYGKNCRRTDFSLRRQRFSPRTGFSRWSTRKAWISGGRRDTSPGRGGRGVLSWRKSRGMMMPGRCCRGMVMSGGCGRGVSWRSGGWVISGRGGKNKVCRTWRDWWRSFRYQTKRSWRPWRDWWWNFAWGRWGLGCYQVQWWYSRALHLLRLDCLLYRWWCLWRRLHYRLWHWLCWSSLGLG